MIYETQKHHGVIVGSDFIVCELCALEKAGEKHITVAKAKRELMGNYVGQHFLKIGDLYICESCLKKALDDIEQQKLATAAHKIAIGDVSEEDDEEPEPTPEEEKPKRGRRKKRMKTKYNTQGFLTGCVNYDPCPLCYGCRAFDPGSVRCINRCEEKGAKWNICDKKKHTEKALSLMIKRPYLGSFTTT